MTSEFYNNEIISLYNQGNSLRDIEKILHLHKSAIYKILKKNNILRERGKAIALSKLNDIPISKELQNIINGELLGDGHITVGNHQSCFSYGTSKKEYAEWLSDLINNHGLKTVGNGVYQTNTKDGINHKYHMGYRFNTISTIQLHEQRNRWYKNNIKIVPKDLILSKESLLHWWIGDGTFNKKSKTGWIATDSFAENEVVFLSNQINDLLNTKLKVNKCSSIYKNIEKDIFRIYIPRESLENILYFIGPCPVKCYKYKWGKND